MTIVPRDELYTTAVIFVLQQRKITLASMQRHLRIEYTRTEAIIKAMENACLISRANDRGARKVLAFAAVKAD